MATFLIRRGSTRRIVYAGPMLLAASALNRVHALQAQKRSCSVNSRRCATTSRPSGRRNSEYRDAVERRRRAEEDLVDHYRAVAEWARVRNESRVLH
jgi:hypothetical protein